MVGFGPEFLEFPDNPVIQRLGFFPCAEVVEQFDRQIPLLDIIDSVQVQEPFKSGEAQIRL